MSLLPLFLFCLPLALAGDPLQITGYVQQTCKEGETCPVREPMVGHTVDVWNCNGKCTKVTMDCGIDKFKIAVETDRTSKVFVYALGDGTQAHNASGGLCDASLGRNQIHHSVDLSNGRADDRPLYTYADISYDRCGTVKVDDNTNPLNPDNIIFKNELDIVEFLQVQSGNGGKTPIYQVSHTRVKVECCHNPPLCEAQCSPVPPPPVEPMQGCDVNDFSLACNSYSDSESFCCDVHLDEKFNTDDIGWVLDSCEGVDLTGNNETVVLYQNGNGATSGLEVVNNIIGEGNSRQHTVSGPWFQFDRDPSNLGTHTIGVKCTVRLVNKTELETYQPTATSGCPAPPVNERLSAGFFQAGQLTLIR